MADRYDTIGEPVALPERGIARAHRDAFVGKPLSNNPANEDSQIWTGRMSNGGVIVGLFNRESAPRTRSLSFADIGITGEVTFRDLWQHAPLGVMGTISVELAPHASLICGSHPL